MEEEQPNNNIVERALGRMMPRKVDTERALRENGMIKD
jgi:hypothetical protein